MKKNLLLTLALAGACLFTFAQDENDGVTDQANLMVTLTAPTIDGDIEGLWDDAAQTAMEGSMIAEEMPEAANFSANFKTMVDADNLYLLVEITDDVLSNDTYTSADGLELGGNDDGFDIVIDASNSKTESIVADDNNDFLITVVYTATGTPLVSGTKNGFAVLDVANIEASCKDATGGWVLEMAISLEGLGISDLAKGDKIGFGIRYNDDDQTDSPGIREGNWSWELATHWKGWNQPVQWGELNVSDEINEPSSIFNTATANLEVYPNPASEVISIDGVEINASISVINMVGQEVISAFATSENMEINVANLVSGVYFIKVGNSSQKIIIE